MLGTAAALLAGGLAACGGSGDGSPLRTTLFVYLLGSNLESRDGAGTDNLLEMLAAQGAAHTRIVITTGGANKRSPGGPVTDWTTVKRFELADGKLKELADLGKRSMDAADTLQDFLTWGARAYPADRTMLVLWDHGGGYYGYGSDENFPDQDIMRLPALAAALRGFQAATGITLDYIGFDACLMATVEVAHVLQPYARYLGASQELEPGSGWDWKAVVEAAAHQPALTVPEFGKATATAFVAKQTDGDASRMHIRHPPRLPLQKQPRSNGATPPMTDYVTFSITDLARIRPLMERLDQWARAVLAYYASDAKRAGGAAVFWPPAFGPQPQAKASAEGTTGDAAIERWKQVAMARVRTTTFGYSPSAKDTYDLVDLRQLAALLAAEGIATGPQAALEQALQDAIVFNITGPEARNANGLSIYFPLGERSPRQQAIYQPLAMPDGYLALLERHTGQAQQAPSAIHVGPLHTQGNTLSADITSVYGVQLADLTLVQPVSDRLVKVTGTAPFATSSTIGQGNSRVHYDTQAWPQLGGQPLLLDTLTHRLDEFGGLSAIVFGAPVRLTSAYDGQSRIVLLLLHYAQDPETLTRVGEIIGAQDIDYGDPGALPDRVDRDIYEGDIVEPIHLLYDVQAQAPLEGLDALSFGPPVTMALDSALRPAPLAAGTHTLVLSVTDLAGEEALSQPLVFVKE
jgi:hypothetical protein